ncbi:MAG: hypothetical protein ACM31C_10725, partial [Acidobacteriota bacterium]
MMMLVPAFVAIIDPGDGIELSPPVELAARGDTPGVAVDGQGAVATWVVRGARTCVVAARLDAAGRAGTPVELACPRQLVGGPAIAASPSGGLVVWGDGDELVGVTLSRALQAAPAFRIAQERPIAAGLSAAFDGKRFWIAWASCASALLLEVDAAGHAVRRPRMLNNPGTQAFGRFTRDAFVACDGADCEVQLVTTDAARLDGVLDDRASCIDLYNARPNAFREERHAARIHDGVLQPTGSMPSPGGLAVLAGRPLVAGDLQYPVVVRAAASGAGVAVAAITQYNDQRAPLGVQFVHRSSTSTRHAPIPLPGETSPAIAALGGDRYVLVTQRKDAIVARVVTTRPDRFASVPPPRPPLVQGVVVHASGTPATGAQLFCITANPLGCGSSATPDEHGNFRIDHPTPDDHRASHDLRVEAVVATAGTELAVATPGSGPLRISLAPAATIDARIAWPGGKPPTKPVPRPSRGEGYPRRELPPIDPAEVAIDAITMIAIAPYTNGYYTGARGKGPLTFAALAPGVVQVTAHSADGALGYATIVPVEPGRSAHIELPLGKLAKLSVDVAGAVDSMQSSNVAFTCERHGARSTCGDPEPIAPGKYLAHFTSGRWLMSRVVTVKPG